MVDTEMSDPGKDPVPAPEVASDASTAPEAGATGSGEAADQVAGTSEPENVAPTIDSALQTELEGMGFSSNRCIRALYYTGSSSVEAAVNWIVEHEEDPDIDTPLMVSQADHVGPKLTPEEARKKAAELVERARRRNQEEEKRLEKEREAARIRSGKEMLEAKKKLDEEERKRRIDERRREKDEEKRAKDRILAKLEDDKRERRRKLGLPEVEPPKAAAEAAAHEPKPTPAAVTSGMGLPVKPVSKGEKMRSALRALKQHHKDDGLKVTRCFETLLKYVSNLGQHPDQEKFRKIRVTNAAFQERVGCYSESLDFLALCGFEKDGEFLTVAADKVEIPVLQVASSELNSAITNPYFGVL